MTSWFVPPIVIPALIIAFVVARALYRQGLVAIGVTVSRWRALADDAAQKGPGVRFPGTQPHARRVGYVVEADLKRVAPQMLEQSDDLDGRALDVVREFLLAKTARAARHFQIGHYAQAA